MKTQSNFLILATVALAAASPASAEWRRYEGLYSHGFEAGGFRECGTHVLLNLEMSDEATAELAEFYEKVGQEEEVFPDNELARLPVDTQFVPERLFVIFEGFLFPRGEYGHLGSFRSQVMARKFYDIRFAFESDIENCD